MKCDYCKKKFKPVNGNQKYCSYECKQAAYWVKKTKEKK